MRRSASADGFRPTSFNRFCTRKSTPFAPVGIVAFTGGTDTAWRINQTLAQRQGPIVPFIAETGGLNAMIVDATALPEQVADDVVTSAFRSAGQRCSALRLLCVQEDVADKLTDMIAGRVHVMFASLSSAIPLIKSGRLRALGITSPRRSPSIPELATIAEQGLAGYEAVAWFGVVGPANLPANVVTTLNKVTMESLTQQDVKTRLFNSGVEVRTMGPEEFAKYTESEIQKWAKVVKASGARAG